MAKPVLLTVDDDPDVLRAVERDLRTRVCREVSCSARRIRGRGARPAPQARTAQRSGSAAAGRPSHAADERHRVPGRGHEDLSRRLPRVADAYADTDAAIQAINEIKLHHYLLKPWDPPEENLYPVIDELLNDWLADYTPPFEGLRVLGSRWSPKSYDLREFLARNRIPYQWLDVETADPDAEVKTVVAKLDAGGPESFASGFVSRRRTGRRSRRTPRSPNGSA